jgi:hypothetical protein
MDKIPVGYYQDVTFQLEDGRKIKACVEAFCGFSDGPTPKVVGIEISPPAKIPEGLLKAFSPFTEGE